MSLVSGDKKYLSNIKGMMQSDHKISKNESSCSVWYEFKYTSKMIAKDLERYGVVPQKTYIAEAKNGIENSRHFWRGMFDGDGHIHAGKCIKDTPHRKSYDYSRVVLTSGSKKLLEQWQLYIKRILPNNQSSIYEYKNHNYFQMKIAGRKQVQKIVKQLYQNGDFCLDYKMNEVQKILFNASN